MRGCRYLSLEIRLEGPRAANVTGGAVEGTPERQEVAEGNLRAEDASKRKLFSRESVVGVSST